MDPIADTLLHKSMEDCPDVKQMLDRDSWEAPRTLLKMVVHVKLECQV